MNQCVLSCVVLCCGSMPAIEGFSDRCENAVRDAFTPMDTCWEQCMLGDVGGGEKWQECKIKGISCQILTKKTGLEAALRKLKLPAIMCSTSSQLRAINCSHLWMYVHVLYVSDSHLQWNRFNLYDLSWTMWNWQICLCFPLAAVVINTQQRRWTKQIRFARFHRNNKSWSKNLLSIPKSGNYIGKYTD